MRHIRNSRIGNLVLGSDSLPESVPASPEQEVEVAGQAPAIMIDSLSERQAPQPSERLRSMHGPPVYEGVPVAQRPTHRQISCMTCSQRLEPQQRQVRCHVCLSWIHDHCIETLRIGSKWNADMCLTCQQGMTRQLKAISAQELQKGRHWNQDGWFENFQELAAADLGYATSNNRDLNELEMTLARALRSGLNVYDDGVPASTTDGDAAADDDIRDPPEDQLRLRYLRHLIQRRPRRPLQV